MGVSLAVQLFIPESLVQVKLSLPIPPQLSLWLMGLEGCAYINGGEPWRPWADVAKQGRKDPSFLQCVLHFHTNSAKLPFSSWRKRYII